MSKQITDYEPKNLWKYFAAISAIPRESGHEEKAVDYLENLAKEKGLEYIRDKFNNIVIKVPAKGGMDSAPTVILQGHIDMVCVKTPESRHNFREDGIDLVIDGEWLTARDTSLGADDLAGVAAAIALIDETDISHPPLEILVTIDEEAGMTGAVNLDPEMIKGRILLNLDSMDPGIFYIGCAGGGDCIIEMPTPFTETTDGFPVELRIYGLTGGHSGLEILKATANANKLITRILYQALDLGIRVVSIEGGTKRNVIPTEAIARFVVPTDKVNDLKKILLNEIENIHAEFFKTDPDMKFELNGNEIPTPFGFVAQGRDSASVSLDSFEIAPFAEMAGNEIPTPFGMSMDAEVSNRYVRLLMSLPHGVLAMSSDVPNLVETSNNMGIVRQHDDQAVVVCTFRSSVKASKETTKKQICASADLAGASYVIEHEYPGWKPNMDSQILKLAQEVHQELFGNPGNPKAVHAGLETGLLLEKIPDMDIISFGPEIEFAHSVDEKMHIGSAEDFYKLLKSILAKVGEEYTEY